MVKDFSDKRKCLECFRYPGGDCVHLYCKNQRKTTISELELNYFLITGQHSTRLIIAVYMTVMGRSAETKRIIVKTVPSGGCYLQVQN